MKDNTSRFTVDWHELKQISLALLRGDYSHFKSSTNATDAIDHVQGSNWQGFTRGQLERWLAEGFKTEAIHGLEDFIPPIREKRRFVYSEEGDEFHYDIAAGGSDNYMSHFTKRDEIPGLGIEVQIAAASSTPADALNGYFTWICRMAFAIETAGIDTEINLVNDTTAMISGSSRSRKFHTAIRVKKENEATDFLSWSPMLSPASLRCFGLIAQTMQADEMGANISPSHGYPDHLDSWEVKFNPDTRTLHIGGPRMFREFPETEMTVKLREALREATISLK